MSRLSWPSRNQPEDGFTLVEVLVALGVMFMALLVLAYTMLSSLSAVGYSRQRTEATALANQALEQIRALPASQLFMSSADLGTDPTNLVTCGTNTCFNGRVVPLANFGANPSVTPLTPSHIAHATALPGNTDYTITSYLSYDPTDTSNRTLVATVQVKWSNAQKGGVAANLQVESKVYNAQFNEAPPGIHTFNASAQGSPGTISVSGTVLGANAVNVTFNLPSTSAGMNGTSLPGSTNVGAASAPVSAGVAQSFITAGPANTSLLNTPAISATAQSLAGAGTQGPGTPATSTPTAAGFIGGNLGVDTGSLSGTVGVGSTQSASAVAASAAAGGSSTPGSPALPVNGLGFGQGSSSQTGATGANLSVAGLNLLGISVNLLTIGLVNFVPTGNGNPDLSTVHQDGSSGSPQLQTFNAAANQSFTELDIVNMTLASVPLPPLLKLTGFNKAAYACAGPVACTAPAPVDTGSIQILGGPVIPIATLLSDSALAIQGVNNTLVGINVPLAPVTSLGITGTGITVGSSATSAPGSATVGSPITINLTVDATVLGISLLHVNISVNLGSVRASASYS